jgi:hypothetical protein
VQRFYEAVFVVGLLAMTISIGLGLLACLVVMPTPPEFVWLPWVAIVGPLLVVCIALRCLSAWQGLRWPGVMARRRFFMLYWAAALLFVGALLYGFWMWPAAPLSPRNGAFVDKTGKLYSRDEFDAFDRWQVIMNYFCLAFAVGSVIGMPAAPTPPSRPTAASRAST